MATVSATNILEQYNWRYATKAFDSSKTLDESQISALEDALVLTPSSFGLQPWKFLVVESQEVKDQLPAISWDQQQTKDASHVFVLAVQEGYTRKDVAKFISRMAEVRGVAESDLAGYEQFAGGFVDKANNEGWTDAWSKNQVYIALGQLMATAALLGIDACPMEGIQPEAYDKVLGLEGTGYRTVVICPVGYRDESDKYATTAKVRFAKEEVVQRI